MKQLQNQYHQDGNNYEAVKAKRILVNLFRDGVGSQIYGKYFFDEYPELNNKTIVGIKWNQNFDSQDENVSSDFYVQSDYSSNNLGIGVYYADNFDAQTLFLNLYNSNNELIIQNFPLSCLNQPLNILPINNMYGNITPFDVKLNLKASYIFVTQIGNPAARTAVSLTFYYLDK
jgi:hypothetical protein